MAKTGGKTPIDSEEPGSFRTQALAYQGAVEAVFAIVIGTGAGWWVDRRFETEPIGLVVGATIGFAAFVVRLIRLGSAMNRSPAPEALSGDSGKPEGAPPENGSRSNPRPEDDGAR